METKNINGRYFKIPVAWTSYVYVLNSECVSDEEESYYISVALHVTKEGINIEEHPYEPFLFSHLQEITKEEFLVEFNKTLNRLKKWQEKGR